MSIYFRLTDLFAHFVYQDHDDPTLTPPHIILDHAQILREVMQVYQSSLLGNEEEDEISAGFNQILDIMVDPVVQMCITNSEEKVKLRPRWDGQVFILNCLCYLQVRFDHIYLDLIQISDLTRILLHRASWLLLISQFKNSRIFKRYLIIVSNFSQRNIEIIFCEMLASGKLRKPFLTTLAK